jgi:hypothetical protein
LCGFSLGPIEGLALSVVVGVSVDYLVHFAFAYKHSLVPKRFYKSRAAVLARFISTACAAVTTALAVAPALFSVFAAQRTFAEIFFIVITVSFLFTMFFFIPLLMTVGSITNRNGPTAAALGLEERVHERTYARVSSTSITGGLGAESTPRTASAAGGETTPQRSTEASGAQSQLGPRLSHKSSIESQPSMRENPQSHIRRTLNRIQSRQAFGNRANPQSPSQTHRAAPTLQKKKEMKPSASQATSGEPGESSSDDDGDHEKLPGGCKVVNAGLSHGAP